MIKLNLQETYDLDVLLAEKDKIDLEYEEGKEVTTDSFYKELVDRINVLSAAKGESLIDECDVSNASMLSLNKVYTVNELLKFFGQFNPKELVLIQPKLDGVSATIRIRNNRITGMYLKKVSFNLEQTCNLPIEGFHKLDKIVLDTDDRDIRGEIVIKNEQFERYIDQFNNQRSMVASMLNTKDKTKLGYDDIFSFISFTRDDTGLFETIYTEHRDIQYVADNIHDVLENFDVNRHNCLIDGIVFKVPNVDLGETKRFPRNQIAYKYKTGIEETTITNIIIERNGKQTKLSVVAEVEPIYFGKLKISRVNIGSTEVLERNGLRVGKKVKVLLVGGIIPKIV